MGRYVAYKGKAFTQDYIERTGKNIYYKELENEESH